MPKLILVILLFISRNAIADSGLENSNCKWANRSNVPCLEIVGNISNSSQYSKIGTNKTVITKKEIEQIGAVDLIDVLKTVPDINITQSGPKGQQASMFMRGTNSNHTLVMINGVPINDQSTTQGLHDFGVDFVQTIQQIEIYPGSGASQFGANAIGGVVNIIMTGDFKDYYKLTSDKNANYEFSGNKNFIKNLSSLNIKFGTVKNKTTSARGNSKDEKDGVKNYSANINYESFISDNLRFYNTNYIRQTIAEYDGSSTDQSGYEGDNKMGTFQLGLEKINNYSSLNSIIYYNKYDREYDEKGTIDKYESETIGLKYDYSKKIYSNFSFGIGSEYKYDWGYFDNKGSYEASTKGNTDNISYYGNIGYNFFKNSNISIFSRVDKHKITGKNDSFKVNFEQSFGISNLGLTYMNGLRNPTLYELFGTDNYGYSGNKNLKPEKSNTYEIYSNTRLNQNLEISLRAFKSNIKDNIEYISNKYKNDTDNVDLNQSGIKNSIKFKNEKTNISLFSSLLSSKKENGSDTLRRPRKNYGVNLNTKFSNIYVGDFFLNLNYNHYGKHFDTHSTTFSTIKIDNVDLINVTLNKKIKNNNYFVKISNLLNEKYQKPHGYNQERRMINFGYKFNY